jgi:hypothetical protein
LGWGGEIRGLVLVRGEERSERRHTVQGEELKDFVRAFELGAGINLHGHSRQHKKV